MKTIYISNKNTTILKVKNNENFFTIEGYCNHFNVPNLNNEIVDKNSFNDFFDLFHQKKLNPKINYEHNNDKILGVLDTINVDDNGLYVTANLNKSLPFVTDWIIPNIENGVLNSFSTEGYVTEIEMLDNQNYYCKNFILSAIAIVSNPADYNATFSIKNCLNLNHHYKWLF